MGKDGKYQLSVTLTGIYEGLRPFVRVSPLSTVFTLCLFLGGRGVSVTLTRIYEGSLPSLRIEFITPAKARTQRQAALAAVCRCASARYQQLN